MAQCLRYISPMMIPKRKWWSIFDHNICSEKGLLTKIMFDSQQRNLWLCEVLAKKQTNQDLQTSFTSQQPTHIQHWSCENFQDKNNICLYQKGLLLKTDQMYYMKEGSSVPILGARHICPNTCFQVLENNLTSWKNWGCVCVCQARTWQLCVLM